MYGMLGNRLLGIQDPRMRFGGPAQVTGTPQPVGPGSPAPQMAAPPSTQAPSAPQPAPQTPGGGMMGNYQSPSHALFQAYMQNIWRRQMPPQGMGGGMFHQSPILPQLQRPAPPAPVYGPGQIDPNNRDPSSPYSPSYYFNPNMGGGGGGGPGM